MGQGPGTRIGLGTLLSLNAASTQGTVGTRYDLDTAYSGWALHVQITGAATAASVQLRGTVATSSMASTGLVALTTYVYPTNSSDDTVFITGKPVTAVLAELTSISTSTGTVTAWISGVP